MEQQGGGEVVEEASPISSRPPANQLEEIMRFSGDDGGGGGGGGAAGAGGSSSSGGNRWPREETLALLRIRSEMDGTFRDATLKAPLWEDVSRKLGGLGYKRSAKKCKEKFENVQKYYKRTKEGKGGRNDGKAYKFFSQLEALNTATAAATSSSAPPPSSATLDVTPLSVANPPPHHLYHQQHQQQQPQLQSQLQPQPQPQPQPQQQQQQTPFSAAVTPTPPFGGGAAVSSHSSSTASRMGYDDDDDDDDDDNNMDVDPANTAAGTSSRKRKRMAKEHGSRNMMEFFEAMMRQVLQKQAAMQRSLLEALEKREQERLSREEAWKRQEMSRLAREHELMAQERAASASRDAAIVSLIQKITGHTLHLPPSLTVSSAQPPRPPSPPPPPPPQQITLQQQRSQVAKAPRHQTSSAPSQLQPIMAIPEQQIPPPPRPPPPPQPQPQPRQEKQPEMVESGSSEPASSSRWPKTEVLALINLRSGMESKYQEAGPKGPLWEEISGGMRRIGYNRSAKRCKEKWENINKYYKKIKESNKKRPEDAKTCPYFHQLEALYHDKILGSSSSSTQHPKESSEVDPVSGPRPPAASHASPSSSENKNEEHAEESSPGGLSTQGDKGTEEKPEDIVRELMQRQQVAMNEYEKMEEEEGEGFDMEEEEEKNMGYEVEFQRRDNGPNRGGSGARTPSFLTMVQ